MWKIYIFYKVFTYYMYTILKIFHKKKKKNDDLQKLIILFCCVYQTNNQNAKLFKHLLCRTYNIFLMFIMVLHFTYIYIYC